MKKSFPTIRAEITELMQHLQQIDLPGKIKRESLAIALHDNFKNSNGHIQPLSVAERQLLVLLAERQQAQSARMQAERDELSVKRDIESLSDLLNTDERAARAKKWIEAANERAATAQTAVDAAEKTCAEIGARVVAEMQALEKAKGTAAGAMLAQIKAGTQGKLPPVSRERLDALVMAQEAAAGELLDAREVLAECSEHLAEANHELAHARADETAREVHLLAHDYAVALNAHRVAAGLCGRQFDAPDLNALARQLAAETDED